MLFKATIEYSQVTSSQTISEIVAPKACNHSEGEAGGPSQTVRNIWDHRTRWYGLSFHGAFREGTVFGGRGVSVIGASFSGVPAISCKANKKQ